MPPAGIPGSRSGCGRSKAREKGCSLLRRGEQPYFRAAQPLRVQKWRRMHGTGLPGELLVRGRSGPTGAFLRRKGRAGFVPLSGAAARTTHPEHLRSPPACSARHPNLRLIVGVNCWIQHATAHGSAKCAAQDSTSMTWSSTGGSFGMAACSDACSPSSVPAPESSPRTGPSVPSTRGGIFRP